MAKFERKIVRTGSRLRPAARTGSAGVPWVVALTIFGPEQLEGHTIKRRH